VDYFPYYYQGLVYYNQGDYNSALRLFDIEIQREAIRRSREYRDLLKKKEEAAANVQRQDTAEKVRRMKDEVDKLKRTAADLHRSGNFQDALSRLSEAQKAAENLDPATQADISDRMARYRDDLNRASAAQEKTRRVEKELADGQKLLQEGKPTEAKLRFDSVLQYDAANAAALEGKRRAEEEILASTTKAARERLLREGRELFQAGRYEEALRPLAEAAADKSATEAQELLAGARRYVEGMRQQKEKRVRTEALLAEGEKLLAEGRYADALVRFQGVLDLDPNVGKARDKLQLANRLMGDQLIDRIVPNTAPLLAFLAPNDAGDVIATEIRGPKFGVSGLATDDRGLARLRFVVDGRVVADQEIPPDPNTGKLPLSQRIDRTFELAPGANEIKVLAVDSLGQTREQTFLVTRNLLLHERPWFLPSALGAAAGLVGVGLLVQRSRRQRAVRRRFNPYIAGAPVLAEDMFFGRRKLLARILNVLHHNSLMITGERRIGKTTLLHHLNKALAEDQATDYQFFPVSTDLQGVPESAFFHTVMTDVVETLVPRAETRAQIRFDPEREDYDGRDFSHDLQRIVEELKTRSLKKVKLALLIDEVDVLNEYSERVNQRLRSIFMKTFSEHLVAIMSGVGIKRIWNSEGSPWYNFFDEIELTAFTREEAEALIREPVEGIFRYAPDAVEKILEHSAMKPYVIQKYCIHAVNRMLEDGRSTITVADVDAVRGTVHFDSPDDELAGDRRVAERRASA
jgi:tetratricopeptide (TPR) repeat protein